MLLDPPDVASLRQRLRLLPDPDTRAAVAEALALVEHGRDSEPLGAARGLFPLLGPAEALALLAALRRLSLEPADAAALEAVLAGGEAEPRAASDALEACLAEAQAVAGRRPAAIRRLGRMAAERLRDDEIRMGLARAVGDEVLAGTRFAPTAPVGRRKVFDVFRLNDELDMLRIRLAEMAPWVDRFVIVEAPLTFSGLPKPLHFQARKGEFARWSDQIVHVVLDRWPSYVETSWAREFHQRDVAIRAIADQLGDEDLVLLTDVDEIVDRRAVEGFDGEFANLCMQTFMYFLNYRRVLDRRAQRGNASVWKGRHLRRIGMSFARHMLTNYRIAQRIHDAGWHFNSVGGPAQVVGKLASYSHQEYRHKDEAFFENRIRKIRAGKPEAAFERWEVDERFPRFVRENQELLRPYLL